MKTKIIIILGMIFLIGIASANLIEYFGRIEGTVEVKNPVFYLDKTDIMNDGSLSLKLNDNAINGSYFQLKSASTSSKELFSEQLGINNFYSQKFKIFLDTKAYNLTTGESGSVYISIFTTKENGRVKDVLCNTLLIGINEQNIYEAECIPTQNFMSNMIETDRLKLLLNDGSSFDSYLRVYYGYSRIEVIPQ